MPRTMFLLLALLSPTLAFADNDRCEHQAPRDLALDLSGAKAVVFEIGPHELQVDAAPGAKAGVSGRACASSADLLPRLTLTQERSGDKLVVRARHEKQGLSWFANRYAYLTLHARVPDDVMVQLDVGSGDARVDGAPTLSIDVGSGDVQASGIRGRVTAKVGSGDVALDDIGALHVLSIGSGDLEAANVRGRVEVGDIGSGDFTLRRAGGDVTIGSIGSGDAELRDVAGGIRVDSIGSGDVDAAGVGSDLTVRSVGSGDIRHADVRGKIDVPRRD